MALSRHPVGPSLVLPALSPSGPARPSCEQFDDGVRGCLYYQGPVTNAGQELMIALGGRILSDTRRKPDAVLGEVLESLYRPRDAEAARRLARVVELAEESYFGQWSEELFRKVWHIGTPGEFKLDQGLFGTSPGPATLPEGTVPGRQGPQGVSQGARGHPCRAAEAGGPVRRRRQAGEHPAQRDRDPQPAQYHLLMPGRAGGISERPGDAYAAGASVIVTAPTLHPCTVEQRPQGGGNGRAIMKNV